MSGNMKSAQTASFPSEYNRAKIASRHGDTVGGLDDAAICHASDEHDSSINGDHLRLWRPLVR